MFATDFNPGADTIQFISPACARLATQSAPKKIAAGAVRLIAFISSVPHRGNSADRTVRMPTSWACAHARAKLWPGAGVATKRTFPCRTEAASNRPVFGIRSDQEIAAHATE
jgi:hypothetical protein